MSCINIDLNFISEKIKYGAIGGLYAFNEDGCPDINIIKALNPTVIAQKAPDGLQHPGGDALKVIKEFVEAGGKQVQIYLQDIYPDWPYKKVSIDEYSNEVVKMLEKIKNNPHKDYIVLIPFNEPDFIWFQNDQESYFEAWAFIYNLIRKKDNSILIGGPNWANYNPQLMRSFMKFCIENNCLPDVITWHELNDNFLKSWEEHYSDYRGIERSLGIKNKDIVINEYARPVDLSVPGFLVNWIAKLEKSKVDGCLAFWHVAGNFDDLVVENTKPNSAWWVYKWYSDMTGETVQALPEDPTKSEALASLDTKKHQIRILLNGTDDEKVILRVNGLNKYKELFGSKVKIKIYSVDWSGHEGELTVPLIEKTLIEDLKGERIEIRLKDSKPTKAYYMIISPATNEGEGTELEVAYNQRYEIEDGQNDGELEKDNNYYTSGNWRVRLDRGNYAKVEVDVPKDGEYLINLYYATHKKECVHMMVDIDNKKGFEIDLKPTINKGCIGKKSFKVYLTQGKHLITLEGIQISGQYVSLDFLEITDGRLSNADEHIVLDATEDAKILGGNPQYIYDSDKRMIKLRSGDVIRFSVAVGQRGYYKMKLLLENEDDLKDGKVQVYVNDMLIKTANYGDIQYKNEGQAELNLIPMLDGGVNNIEIRFNSIDTDRNLLGVKKLELIKQNQMNSLIKSYEVENLNNTLNGANLKNDYDFSGCNNNGEKEAKLQFNIITEKEGSYKVLIYYSQAEIRGTHAYNTKVMDKSSDIVINDQQYIRSYFRYTNGDNVFWVKTINVELKKGENLLEFISKSENGPNINKIEVAPIIIS